VDLVVIETEHVLHRHSFVYKLIKRHVNSLLGAGGTTKNMP